MKEQIKWLDYYLFIWSVTRCPTEHLLHVIFLNDVLDSTQNHHHQNFKLFWKSVHPSCGVQTLGGIDAKRASKLFWSYNHHVSLHIRTLAQMFILSAGAPSGTLHWPLGGGFSDRNSRIIGGENPLAVTEEANR